MNNQRHEDASKSEDEDEKQHPGSEEAAEGTDTGGGEKSIPGEEPKDDPDREGEERFDAG